MKIPRDISTARLVRMLKSIGYNDERHRGTHIRLLRAGNPPHAITLFNGDPISIPALRAIIVAAAQAKYWPVDVVLDLL